MMKGFFVTGSVALTTNIMPQSERSESEISVYSCITVTEKSDKYASDISKLIFTSVTVKLWHLQMSARLR